MKKTLTLLALVVAGIASADEPAIYDGTSLTLKRYPGGATCNAGTQITQGRAYFYTYTLNGAEVQTAFNSWLVSLSVNLTSTAATDNAFFATNGDGSSGAGAHNYTVTYNKATDTNSKDTLSIVYRSRDNATITTVLEGLTFKSGDDIRLAYNTDTNTLYFGNYTTGQCLTTTLTTDETLRFNGADDSNSASVFTNSGKEQVTINMVANMANVDTATFIAMTPEPATATLSLLALAGLAARRRRH